MTNSRTHSPFSWIRPHGQGLFICLYAGLIKTPAAAAACKDMFDWETQQLLISPQNDCHLTCHSWQSAFTHQPWLMAQGACPALKLHRKFQICMGLELKVGGLPWSFSHDSTWYYQFWDSRCSTAVSKGRHSVMGMYIDSPRCTILSLPREVSSGRQYFF